MSGFGEALMASFNATYGMVSRAQSQAAQSRLLNVRAAAEEDELTRDREYFSGVRDAQARYGVLDQGGVAAPQAPQVQAPQAPTPQPALQSAAGMPQPAPVQAPAQVQAPTQAPQQSPAPAPTQAPGAIAGAVPTQAPVSQPPVPPEVVQKAVASLDTSNAPAIDAAVIAGAMAPQGQRTPGQFQQDLQKVPRMVQEIMHARGDNNTGPLKRADWNAYSEQVFLLAQRTRKPAEAIQVLAALDKVRTAGLQNRLAMAVAAANTGDAQGAANSLNSASNFLPDGMFNTFKVANGGIVLERRPEPGEKGETGSSPPIPLAQVPQYAMTMLNPQWTLEHVLNRDRLNEQIRHSKVSEGLQAGQLDVSRGNLALNRQIRNDQLNDRRDIEARGASAIRSSMALRDAEAEEAKAVASGNPAAIEAARAKVEAAKSAYAESMATAPSGALAKIMQIDATFEGIAARREGTADRAAGRRPLTTDQRKTWTEAMDDIIAMSTPKGETAPTDPSVRWSVANMLKAATMNSDTLAPAVAFPALKENHQFMRQAAEHGAITPAEYQKYVQNPYSFASSDGTAIRMPGGAMPTDLQNRLNDYIRGGMKPVGRGIDGEAGGSSSMSGARSLPAPVSEASPADRVRVAPAGRPQANPTPGAGRTMPEHESRRTTPAPEPTSTPRSYREMDAAVAAAKRLGVSASAIQLGEIARQYGIPPAELRARLSRDK